ncbi:hypothetical protein PCANB_000934 [Pneumocystis canis]|nr:hypothetical protein PCANB_000934 [Pneumocystis canis]
MHLNELNDPPITRELLEYYKSRLILAEKATYDNLFGRLQEIQHGLSRMHSLERSLQEAIEEIETMNGKNIELADILKEVVGENIALRLKKYAYDTTDCHKIISEYSKHKQYYETIISLLKNKIETQKKQPNNGKLVNELITKCEKLERVVSEGVHEILCERRMRENCELQLKEANFKLEFQEKELKQRFDEANYSSKMKLEQNRNENFLLQQQNDELKHKLIESQNKIDNIKKHSYDMIQEFEKQIKEMKKRRTTKINSELFLEIASLYTKIKSIERIALKFAPLEGHRVNELFSDIEFVKKRAHHIENALFERKKKDRRSSVSCRNNVSLNLVSIPSGSSTSSPTSFAIHRTLSYILYPAGAVAVLHDINKSTESKRFFCTPPNCATDGGIIGYNTSFLANKSNTPFRDNIDTISSQESSGNSLRIPYDKYYGTSVRNELELQSKVREKVKALSCTVISPDGKYIACGKSPRILIYSVTTKDSCLPIVISGHTFGIKCLSFSSDSKYLASIGFLYDATINIWLIIDNSNNVKKVASNRITSFVRDVSWMGMMVITCGLRHIKLWRWNEEEANKALNTGKTSILEGKNIILGAMSDADFMSIRSFGKESIILCSNKGEIFIIFEGERSIRRVFNVGYEISCIDVNDVDNLLWVAGKYFQIEYLMFYLLLFLILNRAYNINQLLDKNNIQEGFKKEIVKTFKPLKQTSGILAIACDYIGHLAVVDNDRSIYIIDTKDESKNQIIGGNSVKLMGVKSLHKNSFNAILMTWSVCGTVSLWDENEACILTVNITIEQPENISDETTRNELKVIEYDYCNNEIITGDGYGMLKTINLENQKELWRQMAHDGEITHIDSGVINEKYIMVSSGRDRTIQVWSRNINTENWNLEQTLDDHNSSINKARFHKKCQILISCSADRTIIIRKLNEETQNTRLHYVLAKIISLRSTALDFAFISEDSSRFFVSTLDRQLLQCDIQGQVIGSYKTSEEPREMVFLDNIVISKPIITSMSDNTKKTVLEQRFIAGLGSDKAVRIYDLTTCSFIAKNYIHTDGLTGITWLESGQSNNKMKLVSSGLDVLAVWELTINDFQKLTSIHGISTNSRTPIRKIVPKGIIGSFTSMNGSKDLSVRSKKIWSSTPAPHLNINLSKSDNDFSVSKRSARLSRSIINQIDVSKRRSLSPVQTQTRRLEETCFSKKLSSSTNNLGSTVTINKKNEINNDNIKVNNDNFNMNNDEITLTNEINLLIDKLKQVHSDIKIIKKKDTQKKSMLFYTLENQLISMLNDLREQSSIEIENPNRELLERYSMELIALIKDKMK